MKKLFFLLCFVFSTTQIYSQVFEENFDYFPVLDPLTNHGWVVASAGINPILVTIPGLVYPCYPKSDIGNAATLLSTGEDLVKDWTATKATGSVYTSFMFRFGVTVPLPATGDYFIANVEPASTTLFKGRVHARLVGLDVNFGITKGANADVTVWGPTNFSPLITYLVVLKYTFVGGTTTDDLVSLYVFTSCVPAIEPAVPEIPPTTFTSTDAVSLGRTLLRQGGLLTAPIVQVDGITVTNDWGTALPVEMAAFTSTVDRRDVTLNWTTATENNNSGFDIERSMVNGQWSMVGNVVGNGTSTTPNNYSYTDRSLASGSYNYRLKQIDLNGNFTYYNLSNEVNVGVPAKFDLSQNYPNPFNPSTKINYDLPFDGNVSIKIFDMSGKEVATLVNEVKTAGYYSVDFNAISIASGIYFYRINAEANGQNFVSTKKMMLVK